MRFSSIIYGRQEAQRWDTTDGKIELMDAVMAVYRVHSGSTWSSLPSTTRLRESARMLRALDKHLGFRYSDVIRETIARPYLELASTARLNGSRTQTGKYLLSCLRNGGWRVSRRRRPFGGLCPHFLLYAFGNIFANCTPGPTTQTPTLYPSGITNYLIHAIPI